MSTRLLVVGEVTADHYLPGRPLGPDEKIVTPADVVRPGGVGASTAISGRAVGTRRDLGVRMPEEDESSHASNEAEPAPDPSEPDEPESDDQPPDSEAPLTPERPGFIPRLNPLADSRLDAIALRIAGAQPGPAL